MYDYVLVCSILAAVRLAPFWSHGITNGRLKQLASVGLKLPVLLLPDIWYRGLSDAFPSLWQLLIENGWTSDNWPRTPVSFAMYCGL